ncbi:MAG: AAA family ATPase, partial [Salibacteraceae bacterium]|nr:AAA family ATPase [Salibacteraceae bacterium]
MESEEKNLNPENGENQPINQPEATQPQAENVPENIADQAKTESTIDEPPTVAAQPVVATQSNKVKDSVASIKKEIQQVLVGMDEVIDQALVAMFSDGHVLFEGFPGVAKTLMVKLISKTLSTVFKRIQFTPDMMPSDVIGTNIFDQKTSDFIFKKGPIFSNLVLIDEINRAPAKTQAALFEVMEERQITVEGKAYKMDYPFLVIATQNPIDQE